MYELQFAFLPAVIFWVGTVDPSVPDGPPLINTADDAIEQLPIKLKYNGLKFMIGEVYIYNS